MLTAYIAVGRWQKGKDLNWYAKSDDPSSLAAQGRTARAEEIRQIKEAEAEAMAAALGLPVSRATPAVTGASASNSNETPIGKRVSDAEVKRALAEAASDNSANEDRGIGFGGYSGAVRTGDGDEVLSGVGREDPAMQELVRLPIQRSSHQKRHYRTDTDGGHGRDSSRERYRELKNTDSHGHRRRTSRAGPRSRSREPIRSDRREREEYHRDKRYDRPRRRSRSRSPDRRELYSRSLQKAKH